MAEREMPRRVAQRAVAQMGWSQERPWMRAPRYALRDVAKPYGVAGWEAKLVEALPEELKGSFPTVEEIEAELGGQR